MAFLGIAVIALLLLLAIILSVFNALVLFWLGLTVYLSAERRSEGVYLILAGMLMGTLFFISHTAILTSQITPELEPQLNFWWRVGWIPVISVPIVWYLIILWYTGWPQRHRPALIFLLGMVTVMLGLMVVAHPLPKYTDVVNLNLRNADSLGGIPLMFFLYPIYTLLCIVLPLDALRRPMPSERMMGDLARERSRPYLMIVSLLLLGVSLVAAGFLIWVLSVADNRQPVITNPLVTPGIVILDFGLTALITGAVIFLGRAVVSYEVFTGKTLPRRGFFRHWRNAIILASAIAGFIGVIVVIQPPPLYSLLILAAINMLFYALLSWRSFVHRDYLISRLRPLVGSQQLVQHLTNPNGNIQTSIHPLFETLCRDMLNTRQAALIPIGPLAPLAGGPLFYPAHEPKSLPTLNIQSFSADIRIVPLNDENGFKWAIPLWAERGLIGVLLLDEKMDNGLYTQEEIESAGASAERIIDVLAGEEMGRRLMQLQRQRHTEDRMMDLRTRRVLHDEILPTLHLAALHTSALSRTQPEAQSAVELLTEVHGQISELIQNAVQQRAYYSTNVADGLRRLIEDEFEGAFEKIGWTIDCSPALPDEIQDILFHAVREVVRNAVVHGQAKNSRQRLCLTIKITCAERLGIEVMDNGVGMQHGNGENKIGSGSGLALHSTILAIVGGDLTLEPAPDGGTKVRITLPVSPSKS